MPYPVENGGSAFPTGMITEGGNVGGMSLRDYFAAQALSGLILKGHASLIVGNSGEIYAGIAYQIADAMLQERLKQPATK